METLTTTTARSFALFQTLADPILEEMHEAATAYQGKGWLAFVGSCGTGKTFLGNLIVEKWRGRVKHWPKFMARMRSGQFNVYESVVDLCAEKSVLLIDELGLGNDNRDFGLDLLIQVMEGRKNRPTIWTSNLKLAQLANIDARIASRLLRNGRVVECVTKDFALR